MTEQSDKVLGMVVTSTVFSCMLSTPQELRSGIHSSNMKKDSSKEGEESMGKKINVKVVKAIPISSLIYGFLKCQRAFLSVTFYFYSNRLTANGTEAIM